MGKALHLAAEVFTEFLHPTRCVLCEAPSELICPDCEQQMTWINQRYSCPLCGAAWGYLTCTECRGIGWGLENCISAHVFDEDSARIVRSYKDFAELRLAALMAEHMYEALKNFELHHEPLNFDLLAYVPATKKARLKRGFDHMEELAEHLAYFCSRPVLDFMDRVQSLDQRGLSHDERKLNAEGSVKVKAEVTGLKILLLDDVVTTGATLTSCAAALKEAGADRVYGLSFARVC